MPKLFYAHAVSDIPPAWSDHALITYKSIISCLRGWQVLGSLTTPPPLLRDMDEAEGAGTIVWHYFKDIERSSLVLADLSFASTGVGIELCHANSLEIPIIGYYCKTFRKSAPTRMVEGLLHVQDIHAFETPEDAILYIPELLEDHKTSTKKPGAGPGLVC